MTRVYIAGPMSGLPDYNKTAFLEAESMLRERGYDVVNPWRFGDVEGWGGDDYMKRDIPELAKCDAIYMLSGWWHSRGAKREWVTARYVLGLGRIK